MALKKCPVCGATYNDRHQVCPKCDLIHHRKNTRLESCTGVRYPCKHSCHPCYFERVYGDKPEAQE